MITCPKCNKDARVRETRQKEGDMVRRRVCDACNLTIMTVETIYDVRTSKERFNAQRDGMNQRHTRRQARDKARDTAVEALTAGLKSWR